MKFFTNFDEIEVRSHPYLHCNRCNGMFLCKENLEYSVITSIICPHCKNFGCINSFIRSILDVNVCESEEVIQRLSLVVAKLGPLQEMLELVGNHHCGISNKELLQFISMRKYKEKYIGQAINFGLISELKRFESDDSSLYYITQKGSKVLNSC